MSGHKTRTPYFTRVVAISTKLVLVFSNPNYQEKIWKQESIVKILSKQNLVLSRQIQDF